MVRSRNLHEPLFVEACVSAAKNVNPSIFISRLNLRLSMVFAVPARAQTPVTTRTNRAEGWLARSRRLLLTVGLCGILVGAGLGAEEHNCLDSDNHHADHCALCAFASSAAESSPTIHIDLDQIFHFSPLVPVSLPHVLLVIRFSDSRAPPFRIL